MDRRATADSRNVRLSFSANSTFNSGSGGHTAVVQTSNVSAAGSGTVTIIEENASSSGTRTFTVQGWKIQGTGYTYIKWLHYKDAPLPPPGPGTTGRGLDWPRQPSTALSLKVRGECSEHKKLRHLFVHADQSACIGPESVVIGGISVTSGGTLYMFDAGKGRTIGVIALSCRDRFGGSRMGCCLVQSWPVGTKVGIRVALHPAVEHPCESGRLPAPCWQIPL